MMNRRALVPLALAAYCGCYNRREVPRSDWPVLREDRSITVRTLDGNSRRFDGFVFTTTGLSGWRFADTLRVGSTLIPLDSIAVVRVSEFNKRATLMLVAAATTAAFIVISNSKSSVRPPAAPPSPTASCPFVYSFDGKDYILDSETYAGAVARGLERTDVDNLEHLRAVAGRHRLLVRNDRPETDYTDELTLTVVDHPRQTRAIPDAAGVVHVVREGTLPASPRTYGGDTIPSRAGWEMRFARPPNSGDTIALVVRTRNSPVASFVMENTLSLMGSDVYAWYASMQKDLVTRTVVRSWIEREGYLEVQAGTGDGSAWRTVGRLPDVGGAIAKTNVILVDVSKMLGDSVSIRLESSPGMWILEHAELAAYHGRAATATLRAVRATDERGADVGHLLAQRDGKYLVATRGSVVALEYDVPAASTSETTRSVLLNTTGFYVIYTDDTGPPRRDIVERMMRDRAFAQSFFAEAWTRAGHEPLIRARTP
jgi:hypothetical protein